MVSKDDPGRLIGRSRETTIARDSEGRWYHDGVLIERESIRSAFDRWVSVAPDGRFCLKNEINWAYITLDGAPFFVRSIEPYDSGLKLSLSDGTEEFLRPESLRQGEDGALYCTLERGLTARFDRSAQFQLEPWLDEDDEGLFIEIGAERVRPPVVREPLKPLGRR